MIANFLQGKQLWTVLTLMTIIRVSQLNEIQIKRKIEATLMTHYCFPDFRCPLKDCDAAIDFAAFMLAMVLVRHVVNVENANQQWTAEKLAENNNEMVYSDHPNFNIDSRALKQEMALFSPEMMRRSIEVITMHQEGTSEFFSLSGRSRSFEIKFSAYSTPPDYTECQLLHEFRSVRDMILKKCHYHPSTHSTPASVFGCLYHGTILSSENNENDINETSSSVATGKRIKKCLPMIETRDQLIELLMS